ncbi:MAG TPA: hypothetical protein GXX50_00130 [Firmicutes bacterium]|jgi:hypothetical protein|uniref:hypothetical protein n=1 Tax=Gelria sp. Kuro-4 TaxID=2796927 RepID=UPI001990206D|nr:hypothetical protein [Gelria sp. Kuro-4]MDK2926596.1 hypothetical protein [Bacillota bacterium]BCV24978.1 hypothetical protein kuro4_17510 [Gelria sp. Kuro-4]HHV56158.1 hypothetical protein [Bacillota bacterium]
MEGGWDQLPEEELKAMLARIARICASQEFQDLRLELEGIYRQANAENPYLAAFQDALYALLVQGEGA